MTTLVTLRSALRGDLNDPTGATPRWTDADLDRAIARAVAAYTEAIPRVQSVAFATTPGSRIVSLTTLGTITTILGVEWPIPVAGTTGIVARPPWRHDVEANAITLVGSSVPTGDLIRLTWSGPHIVDTSTCTVADADEALVLLGASGYACLAYGTAASDNFRYTDGEAGAMVDDTTIGPEWRARATGLLERFDRDLKRIAGLRARSVRARIK